MYDCSVARRDDLLALDFEFVNLRLAPNPPRLVRDDPDAASFLIVWFPSQHVLEEAFSGEAGAPPLGAKPARSLHAGPSRLVFALPDDRQEMPFTLEALLDWYALNPVVPLPIMLLDGSGPPLTEPDRLQTAIEFPTGLILAPDTSAGWAHQLVPVTRNGRTELWHTRLGTRRADGEPPVDERAPAQMRAYWSIPLGDPFLASLDDRTRRDIVRLSSDFSLRAHPPIPYPLDSPFFQQWQQELLAQGYPLQYIPQPITANPFMLTSAGAWARLESKWGYPTIVDEQQERFTGYPRLSLEQWQHIVTGGRDQYVRTVRKGYLCPTGNRASLITITERQFAPKQIGSEDGHAIFGADAYLRQFHYIIVQEPEQDYAALAASFRHGGNEMPLRRVRITTRETPLLRSVPAPGSPAAREPYWPQVGDTTFVPFRFDLIAEDWEGQPVSLAMPLLFVPLESLASGAGVYNAAPIALREASTQGQRLAFAPSDNQTRGATTLTTASLTFQAQAAHQPGKPRFLPEIVSAKANIPAVDRLLGRTPSTAIRFDATYLDKGFDPTANPGTLFVELTNPPQLPFSPEKAGGLVAPNLGAKGLSRALGPVSSPDAVKAGTFDTSAFATTRLLGGITLGDVLAPANLAPQDFANSLLAEAELQALLDDPGRVIKAPVLAHRHRSPDTVETRFVWKPEIKPLTLGMLTLQTQLPNRPRAELVVDARTIAGPDANGATSTVRGELRSFGLEFAGILTLTVDRLMFHAMPGKKVDVSADGVDLTFAGPLQFVNTLKDILPSNGFSDPPALTVDAEGVKAGYTLGVPSVGVGVFSLQNISLSAGLSLPFVDKPAGVRFAISERHKPFLVTVSLFGGGGFFGLALNASGIEQIEAAIEFGGNISLNLGIASGGVYVMAGIYFGMLADCVKLTGYLRCGGFLEVLGIVSISVEFYLGFTYREKDTGGGEAWGQASLKVCVKIAFFSKSITLTVERKFAGAAGDPTFEQMVSPVDWARYCAAFA